jgi:pilus assembly protein CpaE
MRAPTLLSGLASGKGAASDGGDNPDVVAFMADAASLAVVEQLCAQRPEGRSRILRKGGVDDAIRCLTGLAAPPEVLIIDVSSIDLPLSEIDRLADVCEPGVRVVVVGDREDVGLFRQLIRLGVADYVVKPVNFDLLMPHLGEGGATAAATGTRTGKLLVVTGARGGVGATTVAANLGWYQANVRKRRVALIDLDFHGAALGSQLDLGTGELAEVLAGSGRRVDPLIVERTLRRHGPRLVLLSGETPLDRPLAFEPDGLGNLVELLERQHHYVVVDLPRLPGPAYAYLLRRAAIRVVVSNRTLPATRSLARLLDLLEGAPGRTVLALNEDRPLGGGLVTRQAIEEALGRRFDVEIPYLKQAPLVGDNLGEPLVAKRNAFTQAIEALANGLAGERPATGGGFWQRLRKG